MKILSIASINVKGQVVIPKEIRLKLKIDETVPLSFEVYGSSIIIKPIKDIITSESKKLSFLEILKQTQGSWSDDYDEKLDKKEKLKLESKRRKENEW